MASDRLRQGIAAVQAGDRVTGQRLLSQALQDASITGDLRATGLIWLAETVDDAARRQSLYEQALAAQPTSPSLLAHLDSLMLPTVPPAPQVPVSSPEGGHAVALGVLGGPLGDGSGTIVSVNGVLATARSVVGGQQEVALVSNGQTAQGRVLHSYPDIDLALVETPFRVQRLPAIHTDPLPDGAPLTARTANGGGLRGEHRAVRRQPRPEWFPTTFVDAPDAGGNPVLDGRGRLVGLLTHAIDRSTGTLYALSISVVLGRLEAAARLGFEGVYCPTCGERSVAGGNGLWACEFCGGVLPPFVSTTRRPLPAAAHPIYALPDAAPCRHCRASVGAYKGQCLRCSNPL